MSNPKNGFNTISGFNKYKSTYYNGDVDVSGGDIINRTGNLYLASDSSIYTSANQIQFDDTYSFTNFLNSINVYGQFKLNYSSIEYDVGLQCEKTDTLVSNVATLSPIVSDTAFKCTNFYYDQASNSTVWSGLLTCSPASIASSSIANTTRFIEGTGVQNIAGVKTFLDAPVMSGGSINAGSIPLAKVSGTAVNLSTAQSITSTKSYSVVQNFNNNIRLDGSLLLSLGTITLTNANLQKIALISTITSDIQTQLNTTNSNVTSLQNNSVSLSALNTFSGATNTFTNNIRHDGSLLLNSGALTITNSNLQKLQYISTLTSDIQTQLNTTNSNVTSLQNNSVSLSALNTFSGATNTFTNNIRHDGSLLLNGGALTITNSNLQKLQYCSTITSDIQSQVTNNTTNITTNTNSINTANTNITTNTNNINTANTNITTNTNSINSLNTKTTGISYTAPSGVLSSYTTITNDFLKATSIEFTTNINNVSATIFERLRNITSDVQQQFTTLTNSISASTVPIATIISNLNPNLQTQSGGQYLLCNGQAVNRVTYANLFAVIGLNFGFPTGDYDSFYIPNYSGLFIRAQGNQTINGVFYTSSSNYYTFQSDGMQDHTHGGPGGTYLITQYQQPENSLAQGYSKSATNLNRPNSQSIGSSNYINSAGARTSTDVRPGNYSAYYYIKT